MTTYEKSKLRTSGVLLGRIAVVATTRRKVPFLCRVPNATSKPSASSAPGAPSKTPPVAFEH